jgi:hypothetical protein
MVESQQLEAKAPSDKEIDEIISKSFKSTIFQQMQPLSPRSATESSKNLVADFTCKICLKIIQDGVDCPKC